MADPKLTREKIEQMRPMLYEHVSLHEWPYVDALCDMALKTADLEKEVARLKRELRFRV